MHKSAAQVALNLVGFGCGLCLSPSSLGQQCTSTGPDLIVGDITGPSNYSSLNGIEAFSVGHYLCNIGDQPANCFASTTQHPVWGASLFKLTLDNADGSTRIEQLGYTWLMHGFFALSTDFCCTDCVPTDGTHFGVHCADPHTSARAGSQAGLGPRWQVNAYTGVIVYPPANPPWSGSVARRLQAHISDLEPNTQMVQYFVEAFVIAQDDAAAGNSSNNATYRPASMTGGGSSWNLGFAGAAVREKPAIHAWTTVHAGVLMVQPNFPDDGNFVVAARANDVSGRPGWWHYEYAVYNLNSARCARSFQVPLETGVVLDNVGFHDVDYHDGDGPNNINYDGADWTFSASGVARWETQREIENLWANALRWGTMYNFRFDADAPPVNGNASIEAYAGPVASLSVGPLPIPGYRNGDTNGDGEINLADLASVLSSFGLCQGETGFESSADFDRDGCISLNDLGTLLSKFGE